MSRSLPPILATPTGASSSLRSFGQPRISFVCYSLSPRLYVPRLHWAAIRSSLSFGIPFQLQSIIPVSQAIVIPLILVIHLSMDDIGLIFWVVGLVSIPRIIAINYNQIIGSSHKCMHAEEG